MIQVFQQQQSREKKHRNTTTLHTPAPLSTRSPPRPWPAPGKTRMSKTKKTALLTAMRPSTVKLTNDLGMYLTVGTQDTGHKARTYIHTQHTRRHTETQTPPYPPPSAVRSNQPSFVHRIVTQATHRQGPGVPHAEPFPGEAAEEGVPGGGAVQAHVACRQELQAHTHTHAHRRSHGSVSFKESTERK